MEKNYNPSIEDSIYSRWLEKKYFHAVPDESKKPFTIVIPPPNITGQLHMGHALNNTVQDILIRVKRMQGYNALWMPGTDHASISTEVKIVDSMAQEGLTKGDIGRDEFLRRAWRWKEQYGGTIIRQLKKLGCSCDWDRERFTMDEGLSDAVLEVFVRLYQKGEIYRGQKLINWCPHCKTTISDAEVEHNDKDGTFYYFKYPIKGTDDFLEFATTRPETILGDTAVAVNPEDDRYKKYIGKTVVIPVVDREVPIIADSVVEMDFGTGVVKITPAHDPNDYEVGERHNLPKINIMNDDGTLNENAGKYCGFTREKAREDIVGEFKELGLFIKTEAIVHAVGVHDRCHQVIEPLIKLQWFVKMEELAKPAMEIYKSGGLKLHPARFGKIYMNWLENIKDWCISRQLWWGHRIPAYYCAECGRVMVAKTIPDACPECGCTRLTQDEDTLDTWFSSALWPFSTLGWPERTKELEHFYPTDVLVTAYEIIFFWVVRMVFSGMEFMGQLPFKDVLITGLIRDSQGRKMSKSLGNGIDPLEIIDKYGADALRLCLIYGNAIENDTRFYNEKLDACRHFLNKLWNASRFVLMNIPSTTDETENDSMRDGRPELKDSDKWILSKANSLIKEVTEKIEQYEIVMALQMVYDFVWDEFCDWYIEMVKPRLYGKEDGKEGALWTLKTVLSDVLKLLHPYAPFITEEIYLSLHEEAESIMISAWPEYHAEVNFPTEEREIELVKEAVRNIRNLRAEMNVAPSVKLNVTLVSTDESTCGIFDRSRVFFIGLSGAASLSVKQDREGVEEDSLSVVIPNAVLYLPVADVVDREKERERRDKERKRLMDELDRTRTKLSNPGFVNKAPEKVVQEERDKEQKYMDMLKKLEENG